MKQVRVLSNTIAEELQESLNQRGIVLENAVLEAKVSEIVSSVYEAVEDTDKEDIVEDSKVYYATAAATIGGKEVGEGEYVELEETDDGIIATIYDEDGEVKEENIKVTDKEQSDFLANAEELEDDDEDYFEDDEDIDEEYDEDEEDEEVDEAGKKFKIKNGKKVKLSKNQIKANKLRKSGRLKKGYKLSADGKIVKMSAAEKKARKLLGKKLSRKGKAKRKKSQAKAQKIAAGAQSGSVKEGFDITAANGLKIAVEEGDELRFENNLLSVVREGNIIISGIEVHEGFIQTCVSEEVLILNESCDNADEKEVKEGKVKENNGEEPEVKEGEEEEANEAAMLTFSTNKGYVLVKEGTELAMGNRIRARATLAAEGYTVSSDILDKAFNGEVVTL